MKMNTLKNILILFFVIGSLSLKAQEDLMDMLDEEVKPEPVEVAYTFKSTHIINSHTIERMQKNQLDFRVNHRFGQINYGYQEFWGLDMAKVSLDFGYGINNWLMVGLRRSTVDKTIDGSLKFSLLRQTRGGSKNIPVAVSYYTNMAANGTVHTDALIDSVFTHRLSFTHQLLIARKINGKLSLQLMPTFVHRNLVKFDEENNTIAVGFGGRYKIARRVSITGEYFWSSSAANNDLYYNPLSFGVDIETGGHVFQLFFTNTRMMEESGFITRTEGSWSDGGIYFGFNISRVFALGGSDE
jgi:hypothetical protein